MYIFLSPHGIPLPCWIIPISIQTCCTISHLKTLFLHSVCPVATVPYLCSPLLQVSSKGVVYCFLSSTLFPLSCNTTDTAFHGDSDLHPVVISGVLSADCWAALKPWPPLPSCTLLFLGCQDPNLSGCSSFEAVSSVTFASLILRPLFIYTCSLEDSPCPRLKIASESVLDFISSLSPPWGLYSCILLSTWHFHLDT